MISDPQPVLLEVSAPDSPILPQVRTRQGWGWLGECLPAPITAFSLPSWAMMKVSSTS